MKVTILGSGTGIIRSTRRSPAVLVETAAGESVIVDCGWGVPGALMAREFPLHRLNHLAITHRHADHMSALPSLLQSQFIANIQHLPGQARDEKLTIHGYPGISQDIYSLCEMMVPELDVEKELTIIEHTSNELHRFGDLNISALEVPHVETMPAVSFCIEAEGKKVVVTGDLGWNEAILTQLQDADIAIMDASATQREFEKQPVRSHLAPIQCGELAARANVQHLVLTSLYDREAPEEILKAAHRTYDGTVSVSYDLQVFEIPS